MKQCATRARQTQAHRPGESEGGVSRAKVANRKHAGTRDIRRRQVPSVVIGEHLKTQRTQEKKAIKRNANAGRVARRPGVRASPLYDRIWKPGKPGEQEESQQRVKGRSTRGAAEPRSGATSGQSPRCPPQGKIVREYVLQAGLKAAQQVKEGGRVSRSWFKETRKSRGNKALARLL